MSANHSLRWPIAFIFCIGLATASQAKTYRIARLTTPTIEIGGKTVKTGDTFDSNDHISWKSPRQAMKVIDVATGLQTLLVGEKADASKSSNLEEYLIKNRRMSSRDGMPDNLLTLKSMLDKEKHFLIDTLEVATSVPTDNRHFFYVSYNHNGEEINKLIPNDNGHFFITSEIFTIDGKPIPPFDVRLSLFYIDETIQRLSLVTDKFDLYVLTDKH